MNLNLTTKKNHFIFEADKQITSIWIEKKQKILLSKKGNTFSIQASQVLEILDEHKEDRVKIFFSTSFDQTPKEFSIKQDVSIFANGQLTLNINDQSISLYITLDGFLRFISNQVPSANSYFERAVLKNISNNKQYIILEIEAVSKVFEIDTPNLIVKNRKTKEIVTISSFKQSSIRDGLFYNSTFRYEIKISDILNLLDSINVKDYDATVLDTFFNPTFFNTETTSRQYKIARPIELEEETWIPMDNYYLLLKNYGTVNTNNLAFRTAFIDKLAFDFYEEIKKNNTLKSKSEKKIILISEYPHKAQDNGLQMFNFINSKYSHLIDCYYVINTDSNDLINLNAYKNHIITFKSKEHFELILKTDMILHTHSSNYTLPLITTFMEKYYKDIKKIFLQHGIISERNLVYLYGKDTNPTFTDKFIVSSNREKKIVENELGYAPSDILLTGLARFDTLLEGNSIEKSYSLKNNILIMPSWRQGEDSLSDEDFIQTDFYKEFNSLLNNPEFVLMIKKYSLNVSFYLHTNFQKYKHLFKSDTISILSEGESSVQDLLKNNGILITDFSSVGLDFSLLDRPVLYYQFDSQLKESRKQKKTFLPGPVIKKQSDLLSYLKKKLKKNHISPIYKLLRKKNLYFYNDTNAKQRIMDEVMKLLS